VVENSKDSAVNRNKEPILKILKEVFTEDNKRVFEIGAGTGEHAVHFAKYFKDVIWTTSDVTSNHKQIRSTLDASKLSNVRGPLQFEVGTDDFPKYTYDIVFTANTFHIMSWKQCKNLMKILGTRLREGSQVVIYGPFNYDGKFTSTSNELFDKSLKEVDASRGIRSFEDINKNMAKNGFELFKDYEMPANNRILVFTRLVFMNSL
jgi:cyclopropane fatty-acyl-phospholipid synthase-like methyltransferase